MNSKAFNKLFCLDGMKVKIIGALVFGMFITSCGEGSKKAEVKPGAEAPSRQLMFSKSCSEGSFKVESTSSIQPGSLKVGDKVHISGSFSKSCNNVPVTFACSGQVVIGPNRAFVCHSGTSSLGSFVKGEFHTFDNGTKSSGSVSANNCVLSFACLNE